MEERTKFDIPPNWSDMCPDKFKTLGKKIGDGHEKEFKGVY